LPADGPGFAHFTPVLRPPRESLLGEHHSGRAQLEKSSETKLRRLPAVPPFTIGMRFWIVLAAIASVAAFARPAASTSSHADTVKVSIVSVSYDVAGDSVLTLLEEMRQRSPIIDDGKIYFGHTQSDMHWYFEFQRRAGGYFITRASVDVGIRFTLPRRLTSSDSRNRIAPEWDRYLTALKRHEDGHAQYAIEEAHRLQSRLTAPRVFKDAASLRIFVAVEGAAALAASRRINAHYDAETNHGATQGTVLRWDPESEPQQSHALNRRDSGTQSAHIEIR
jgi:predicted secreted Zn-dependent protease